MKRVWADLRRSPMMWLLVAVPVAIAAEHARPGAHTLLFVLSILAIVPLAALLSRATESVAAWSGDAVGGLLSATFGNVTELVIALTALRAGQYMLVKASIAGAIVANSLFLLGASLLLGGLRFHTQEYNRAGARFQVAQLFLAAVAILIPSAIVQADSTRAEAFALDLTRGVSVLLLVAYALGVLFSLRTHREVFGSASHAEEGGEEPWPVVPAIVAMLVATLLVAVVGEIFVASVETAAKSFGMTPAFVGFVIVPIVGGAAEMATALSAARKNRLDLSIGIALGSAAQIALFVAPLLALASAWLGPQPMVLDFWPGAVLMVFLSVLTCALVVNSGRSAWFVGVLVLMVYAILALTLYLLPPSDASAETGAAASGAHARVLTTR